MFTSHQVSLFYFHHGLNQECGSMSSLGKILLGYDLVQHLALSFLCIEMLRNQLYKIVHKGWWCTSFFVGRFVVHGWNSLASLCLSLTKTQVGIHWIWFSASDYYSMLICVSACSGALAYILCCNQPFTCSEYILLCIRRNSYLWLTFLVLKEASEVMGEVS